LGGHLVSKNFCFKTPWSVVKVVNVNEWAGMLFLWVTPPPFYIRKKMIKVSVCPPRMLRIRMTGD